MLSKRFCLRYCVDLNQRVFIDPPQTTLKYPYLYMLSGSHSDLCLKVLDLYFLSWFFLCSALCFSCWTLDISRTASYEIILAGRSVCLYVSPSVRSSLSFLVIGSLVFADIVHDDSWQWHLVTDGARFLKKNWQSKFGPNGPKSGPKLQSVS